ncbi:ABC transporter permease [Desulfobacula phenolica]|uniref:Molybdate transport system permease protein n=1 Tax=Desulfobacula phenolica TaxID=90732 RepID=A0A1H2IBW4_9BACT|nr:ABC transporter permease [Desulfobacula phenolica]SDU41485.1 molybdate transport system permease protein [Desulfobacula phenolica]
MRVFTCVCVVLMLLFTLMIMGVLVALCLPLPIRDLLQALASRETFFALRLSLSCSVLATIISLLWGVPTGYLLARKDFFGKALLDILMDIPMIIPPLVVGIGLMFLFSSSALGKPLEALGIRILFTPLGACVAQTFIAVPIIIRTSRAAFEDVDIRYESAALTLGSSALHAFFKITLPLAANGILSGALLAMARAMGEFGATLMVAGATRMKTETLPIAVYLNISSGEIGIALACSWILMGAGLILLIILKFIGKISQINSR